jgi:invasion protein IalB
MLKKSLLKAAATATLFVFVAPALSQSTPTTTVHGSWSVECSDQGKRCAATQKVATDKAGQQTVLGVILEPAIGKADAQLTFRMTNTAYVPAGAGIKIGNNKPLRAPISSCDDKVCEVRAWLTPELKRQMRTEKLMIFAYFMDAKRQVSLPVSLNGFPAAMDQLAKVQARAPK